MDTKRLVIGTIAGGVTYFVAGYLIFDLGFGDFYVANRPPGFNRAVPMEWAVALGSLSLGALLALGVLSRGAPTIPGGFVTGAVMNFLLWFGVDFTLYGINEGRNLTLAVIDPLLELIRGGIAGVVIAAVLARVPKSAAIRPAA